MTKVCSNCHKSIEQNTMFCIYCGASLSGALPVKNSLHHKKEKVLGPPQSHSQRKLKVVLLAGVLILAAGWFYANIPAKTNPIIDAQPAVTDEIKYPGTGQQMFDIPMKVMEGKIRIPLDLIQQKKFVAFQYVTPANNVPLLAYISNEGKLVTAVSMCEPCNSKRFHIQGEKLVCNSCGSTWELNNLDAISGACGKYPPDAIPSVVLGNEILIDEIVVANWKRRI